LRTQKNQPAAKAESTADVDDDGRDFGIPPAVIDSDARIDCGFDDGRDFGIPPAVITAMPNHLKKPSLNPCVEISKARNLCKIT
jgi:hypothetical protein